MENYNFCCVFICNKNYLSKFIKTCTQLIENGCYNGNICLIIGDDLNETIKTNEFIIKNKIIIKYFPDIIFPKSFYEINDNINTDGRNILKKFQWHKLYLFNIFLKKWNYILYIDCGMNIFSNINYIIECKMKHTLLAHSDAYPTYEWKLNTQFDKNNKLYHNLNNNYNLNIDYFQTTMMLYDTTIIKENTFQDLYNLSVKYPISRTNEQGIISLYFTNIINIWKQIQIKNDNIYFYDYLQRNSKNKYIMLKCI